ncbi:hypothetical protein SNE40_000981 [Patella caerulea]|uniref:Major facilitator superfamily (MFS) profile domain-containing protein n=1 Tax=Patella caerulea TaxID=87958 RepID=A0AAN8KBM3_PATCE
MGVCEYEVRMESKVTHSECSGNRKPEKIHLHDKIKDVDNGWSWLVVSACFTLQAFISATYSTYGIMLRVLTKDLNRSVFQLSWISSISGGGTSAFSHLVGMIIHKKGHRTVVLLGTVLTAGGSILSIFAVDHYLLYFTMGVMNGIGLACVNMSSLIIIYDYFYLKRAVAMSIANAGLSVGNFIFPYVVNYLIEEYGWRGSSLLMGGFFLQGLCCCVVFNKQDSATLDALLIKDKLDIQKTEEKIQKKTTSLLKDFLFYRCLISQFLIGLCGYIFIIYLPLFCAQRFGENSTVGTFLVSMVGVGSLIGRVIFALIVNKWPDSATLVYAIGGAGCGLCYQLAVLCYSTPLMFIVTIAQGIFNGAWVTMSTMMLAQNFGMERLHLTCGIAYTCAGISTFAGSPLAAKITDLSGNIESAYMVNGALFIISGLVLIPTGFKLVCSSNKGARSAISFINVWITDPVLFI